VPLVQHRGGAKNEHTHTIANTHLAMVHMYRKPRAHVDLLPDLPVPLVQHRGGAHHKGASGVQITCIHTVLLIKQAATVRTRNLTLLLQRKSREGGFVRELSLLLYARGK
jgi:hypothetical protein